MKLQDYANQRTNVVVFWTSVGTPFGETAPLGCEDLDFAERFLDLEGLVEDDDWGWSGEGNPTDVRNNSITHIHAYVDRHEWNHAVEEYYSESY